MRGYTMPTNQTQTFTGPKAGQYQISDLQQLLTGLSGLGSVNTAAGAKLISGLGGGLTDILKGIFSGGNKISYNGNQPIDSGDEPVFDPNVGSPDVYGNQTFDDPIAIYAEGYGGNPNINYSNNTPYDPIFYQGEYDPNTRRFGYDGDGNLTPYDPTI
jgi:hypothetical protein